MKDALQSIKKAAATAKATGGKSSLKRDLKDTAEYDKSSVSHIADMLSALNTARKSLSDMLGTLGSVSAHEISHDGMLGGRGYVMTIRDIRDDVTTAVNLVTNLVDTVSDELTNPKWGLSKEDIEQYKGGTKVDEKPDPANDTAAEDDQPAVQEDSEDGSDLDKIMDMFGDSAPASHGDDDVAAPVEPVEDTPSQDATPDAAVGDTPPSEPQLAPPPPEDDANQQEPDPESALNLPYKKLAALAYSMEADKVAFALRAPILYNILDGHAAH